MTDEVWKPVVGFEGKYEVSNMGRVRSLIGGSRVLRQQRLHSGYTEVILVGNHRRVHRLVLEAFVGPRPDGYQCDHINTVRDDNRIENLRWVTASANQRNPITRGRHKFQKTCRPVLCVETGEVFISGSDAARRLGLNRANLLGVCNAYYGRKSVGGLHFRFVEDAQ